MNDHTDDRPEPRNQAANARWLARGRPEHVAARESLIDTALDDRVVVSFTDHGFLLANARLNGRGCETLSRRHLEQLLISEVPSRVEAECVSQ